MHSGLTNEPLLNKAALKRRIENLDASADTKALLSDLLDVTIHIGDRVHQVGSKIAQFVLDFVRVYPKLSLAIAACSVIALLVNSIPVLGPLLAPVLTPLLLIAGIGLGVAAEFLTGEMKALVENSLVTQLRTFGA